MFLFLLQDSVGEIKKLSNFLGYDYPNGFLEEVADKCSFRKLQKANTDLKQDPTKRKSGTSVMYRKGQVGDWKNWFTIAENEYIDTLYADKMTNTNLKFTFTI
ncbi:hypothetical protein CHS0354_031837 [Potamilus streckersoni]|uniref:Sulfotransferase domain-containing protein n=1 Tax=Potamilus streckersoni TaxID=2493646 RepID=A0AAE0RXN4_9BIVA|nr:hypothetical protein CHS0354_031837 [Potamilus streckersoni]